MLAAVRPAIGLRIESNRQRGQHSIQVAHDVVVREAKDAEAELALHSRIAAEIDLTVVCFAIQFDCQPLHGAEEVHNTPSDHFLTAKLVAEQLLPAQGRPEASLRFGGIGAHLAGPFEQNPARDATTPNPLL